MSHPSLADLRTLLEALDAAGTPLGLEPAWRSADAELTRRIAAGDAPTDVIETPALDAAPTYRRLLRLVLRGVPVDAVLARLHAEASLQTTTRRRLGRGFAYPVLIAAVAAIGLLVLGWSVLPLVESAYADLRKPPGAALRWMLAVRDSGPIWLVLGSLTIGLATWLAIKGTPLRWTRKSVSAGPTARLHQAGVCHDRAALLAAGATATLPEALAALDEPAPPMLAWARETDAGAEDLRAIGEAYDRFAGTGAGAYAAWTPLAATVLVGGGAALLYALALFGPVAELLFTLAS